MKFFLSPLMKEVFLNRIQSHPTFKCCFQKNLTDKFEEELKTRDQVVIWIYGLTGSGKSSIAISLTFFTDRNGMSAKRIVYTNPDIQKAVMNSDEGDSFIRDETVKDFGEGSGQMLSTMQDLTETLRKRRHSFFLLSPVIKGVSFVNYYLEVLQANVNLEKEAIQAYINGGGKDLWFRCGVQDNTGRYLGFIIVHSEINNPLWVAYQKKKDSFLEEMASGARKSGIDFTEEARKLIKEIDFEAYPKKGQRLVFIKQNTNFTTSQVKSIHTEMERLIQLDVSMVKEYPSTRFEPRWNQ